MTLTSALSHVSQLEGSPGSYNRIAEEEPTVVTTAAADEVDRWLKTGGLLPRTFQNFGVTKLGVPEVVHETLRRSAPILPLHEAHRGQTKEVFGVSTRNGDDW